MFEFILSVVQLVYYTRLTWHVYTFKSKKAPFHVRIYCFILLFPHSTAGYPK